MLEPVLIKFFGALNPPKNRWFDFMRVVKVEYLKEYKLKLTFSDKKTKVVDLEDKIKNGKGVFLPLKDLDFFKQVDIDDCNLSICWPNGADICPDVLYSMGKSIQLKKQISTKKLKQKNTSLQRRSKRKAKSKT